MSILDGEDHSWEIDTVGEVVLFTAAVLSVGLFVGLTYFAANPTLDEELMYYSMEQPNQTGGTVTFTEAQIQEVNKVYRDKREEYAWCLKIEEDQVVDMAHPPEVDHNDEESIEFQCNSEPTNGILHTHPGLLAIPELSETDRENLVESDLEVSCVVSEAVPPKHWSKNPPSLNCFNRDLEKMQIRIAPSE